MKNYQGLIEKLADTHSHKYNCDGEKCHRKAKPILIGDVLEKMDEIFYSKREGLKVLEKQIAKLIYLWRDCGLICSVQQIAEDVEKGYLHNGKFVQSDCTGKEEQLKPSSEALLSFIEKLF